jgi:hypothetical protein
MMPFTAVISVPHKRSHTLRLKIPLFLLWLGLAPLGVLLSPLILIACLVCWVNPLRLFGALWDLLTALKDTNVEVAHRSASVSVCIL